MKKLKFLTLLTVCLLLAGCGEKWEDAQKSYGDILKSNPVCNYATVGKASDDPYKITNLQFSADYDGFYIKFNDEKKLQINGSGKNDSINFNGHNFEFESDFLESFIREYINNGNDCPKEIGIKMANDSLRFTTVCINHSTCTTYKQSITVTTTPSGGNIDNIIDDNQVSDKVKEELNGKKTCHHSDVLGNCVKVALTTFDGSAKYSFDFGYYARNGNKNDVGRYFAVSMDDNFVYTMEVAESDYYGNPMSTYIDYMGVQTTFTVPSEEIDKIWYDDKNFKILDKDNLRVNVDEDAWTTVYITSKENENYGTQIPGQNIEDLPDIEEAYAKRLTEQKKVSVEPLEVNPINICAKDALTLKAFQIIGYIIFIMKIVVPLLLIIMASLDFAKAVVSSGEKPNIDVLKKVGTRIGIAVIIFIIPTVLDFLLSLVGGTKETMEGFEPCTACLLDPLGKCQDQFDD